MYRLFGLILACLMLTSVATAANLEKIKKNIEKHASDLPITELSKTPFKGVYELRSGTDIYYVNEKGTHLIAGHMYELATKKDLTKVRLEEINRVDWSSLPLDQAIVSGDPKGKKVAVFTDPDCGYCQKLEKNMLEAKGIQFYTFLFPLEQIHPDAKKKSQAIWCSKDPHAAMIKVMLEGKKLEESDCKNPVEANIKLGQSLGIRGTPTLIAEDGRKTGGALSFEALNEWLDQK